MHQEAQTDIVETVLKEAAIQAAHGVRVDPDLELHLWELSQAPAESHRRDLAMSLMCRLAF